MSNHPNRGGRAKTTVAQLVHAFETVCREALNNLHPSSEAAQVIRDQREQMRPVVESVTVPDLTKPSVRE